MSKTSYPGTITAANAHQQSSFGGGNRFKSNRIASMVTLKTRQSKKLGTVGGRQPKKSKMYRSVIDRTLFRDSSYAVSPSMSPSN